jgi:hypothetical protein
VSTRRDSPTIRIVLEGDTRIVYDELSTQAWITHFQAEYSESCCTWIIALRGHAVTPTDLLRAVLADRRLQVIEFIVLQTPMDE